MGYLFCLFLLLAGAVAVFVSCSSNVEKVTDELDNMVESLDSLQNSIDDVVEDMDTIAEDNMEAAADSAVVEETEEEVVE